LGELFMLSATIKHFEDGGRQVSELSLLEYAMQQGLYTIQQRLNDILDNLPGRFGAWCVRRLVFPYGLRRQPADDALTREVASQLAESAALRGRLAAGMYLTDDGDDLLGCLEHALKLAEQCAPLLEKMRAAEKSGAIAPWVEDVFSAAVSEGVLTVSEAEPLKTYAKALRRAIDVDDFAADELWATLAAPNATADAA